MEKTEHVLYRQVVTLLKHLQQLELDLHNSIGKISGENFEQFTILKSRFETIALIIIDVLNHPSFIQFDTILSNDTGLEGSALDSISSGYSIRTSHSATIIVAITQQ